MKRTRYDTKRKKTRRDPSLFAWIILTVAWLSFVPFSVFIFFSADHKPLVSERVFAAAPQIQYEIPVTTEESPISPSCTCALTLLPAVNTLRSDKPTILIYHTHTTEAYMQTETAQYRETSAWRTNDNTNNVVAVGETLKEILERDYGFTVIHDTTDHEPPKLSTAYDRSLATMEKYHAEYPSVVLFIDLHRDAYNTSENVPCDYLTIGGIETARLMLVVGKGEKYTEKPYYSSNIAFAERITNYLNMIDENLCRPVRIKTGRYNQHVAPNCILVEVGHNANTLAQAKAAMPYFAESIAYSFASGKIEPSDWLPN